MYQHWYQVSAKKNQSCDLIRIVSSEDEQYYGMC